jgi:hypothetical protein
MSKKSVASELLITYIDLLDHTHIIVTILCYNNYKVSIAHGQV